MLVEMENELALMKELYSKAQEGKTSLSVEDGYFVFRLESDTFPKDLLHNPHLAEYTLQDVTPDVVEPNKIRFKLVWKRRIVTQYGPGARPPATLQPDRKERRFVPQGTYPSAEINKCLKCGNAGRIGVYPNDQGGDEDYVVVNHGKGEKCQITNLLRKSGHTVDEVRKFIESKQAKKEAAEKFGNNSAAIAIVEAKESAEVIDISKLLLNDNHH